MSRSEWKTARLSDLADPEDLEDEEEAVFHVFDETDPAYPVRDMSPEEARGLLTVQGDMTVMEAFEQFAGREQRELVQDKIADFHEGRIMVLKGRTVIDGNHHLVAAILSNRPIRYIDVDEPLPEPVRDDDPVP